MTIDEIVQQYQKRFGATWAEARGIVEFVMERVVERDRQIIYAVRDRPDASLDWCNACTDIENKIRFEMGDLSPAAAMRERKFAA